jgi:general secretion pathway protein K
LPLPNGTANVRVRDGGNCFNLNSLVTGSAEALESRPIAIDQFARLMILMDVPDQQARRIAAASADWIDSNGDANPGGAEDSVYGRAAIAYRTGNTLMAEASEWRSVSGVTPALYTRLRPWLCALPVTELSPINVNTLTPDQAPLVAMLFPGTLTIAVARRIISERPAAGWASVGEFWNAESLRDITPPGDAVRQPQVRSNWFAVDMQIAAGDGDLRETALFDARRPPVRIASRRWTRDE